MSEIKVDKISPQSGTALQIGDASDVITIPASATITNNGTATEIDLASYKELPTSATNGQVLQYNNTTNFRILAPIWEPVV